MGYVTDYLRLPLYEASSHIYNDADKLLRKRHELWNHGHDREKNPDYKTVV